MVNAAVKRQEDSVSENLSWPQDVSHDAYLRIGEVREMLLADFPLLKTSKLRHFEDMNLITPTRTSSNQRLYSMADVERLRFILTEQRDRYTPLPQIGEMLRQLDEGIISADQHPSHLRVMASTDKPIARPGTRLRAEELADLTGAPMSFIEELRDASIVRVDPRGRFFPNATEIVKWAYLMRTSGMDMRMVRSVSTSARSHAEAIKAATAHERAKKTPVALERAAASSAEMAHLYSQLYRAIIQETVDITNP